MGLVWVWMGWKSLCGVFLGAPLYGARNKWDGKENTQTQFLEMLLKYKFGNTFHDKYLHQPAQKFKGFSNTTVVPPKAIFMSFEVVALTSEIRVCVHIDFHIYMHISVNQCQLVLIFFIKDFIPI